MQLGAAIFHVLFGTRCGDAHYPGVGFTWRNKDAVVVCNGGARGCCDVRHDSASAQAAKSYQFCSVVSGIGTECIYDNLAQCAQNVEGNGGWCKEGPGYDPRHPEGTGEFPQAPNWR